MYAIAFSFLCGMFIFLPFPGWQLLVGFISSATVIAYAMAPLAMGALRLQEPDRERPFRLVGGTVLAPVGFIIANEIILFSGWAVVWKLLVAILIGFALLAISLATSAPERRPSLDGRSAMQWPYLVGLALISYTSPRPAPRRATAPPAARPARAAVRGSAPPRRRAPPRR